MNDWIIEKYQEHWTKGQETYPKSSALLILLIWVNHVIMMDPNFLNGLFQSLKPLIQAFNEFFNEFNAIHNL